MSYCSETLKDIFLELPLPAGGIFAVFVGASAGARAVAQASRGWRGKVDAGAYELGCCVELRARDVLAGICKEGRAAVVGKTKVVYWALPAGFGRSHGETVGRSDAGLSPTLL